MKRKDYLSPEAEMLHYQLEKSFCDSYTSNSLQDYNLRDDIDIDWD
jgi:hypothetical protein